ncbi:flagellar FliJ family protein [Isoptericola sp. b441]|uniref:Flagellar FliJ protein n=1 Tax=Actinotalea lenta TaxID=3064654 RepID=A0ABT9D7C6_9CELL|nr:MULTISPECIES: flagellar FliJ family protein [unclassified Isoptericola]MDO8106119.1 flagellar FliJ family protein [Isoptericola sp. b441]MDO8122162.1 flagellar FliJ family protein [Isoptericola sp. b490]
MQRRFRLAGLLRLRRLQEEQAAADLARANASARQAEEERDELGSLMAGTVFPRHGDELVWRSAVAARAALVGLVDEATVALDVASRRAELAADAWTVSRTKVSMLDKLAERHEELVRADDERVEQQALDEAAARRRPDDLTDQEDR